MGTSIYTTLQKKEGDKWVDVIDDCIYWNSSTCRYFLAEYAGDLDKGEREDWPVTYVCTLEEFMALPIEDYSRVSVEKEDGCWTIRVKSELYTDWSPEECLSDTQKAFAIVLGPVDLSEYRLVMSFD